MFIKTPRSLNFWYVTLSESDLFKRNSKGIFKAEDIFKWFDAVLTQMTICKVYFVQDPGRKNFNMFSLMYSICLMNGIGNCMFLPDVIIFLTGAICSFHLISMEAQERQGYLLLIESAINQNSYWIRAWIESYYWSWTVFYLNHFRVRARTKR